MSKWLVKNGHGSCNPLWFLYAGAWFVGYFLLLFLHPGYNCSNTGRWQRWRTGWGRRCRCRYVRSGTCTGNETSRARSLHSPSSAVSHYLSARSCLCRHPAAACLDEHVLEDYFIPTFYSFIFYILYVGIGVHHLYEGAHGTSLWRDNTSWAEVVTEGYGQRAGRQYTFYCASFGFPKIYQISDQCTGKENTPLLLLYQIRSGK